MNVLKIQPGQECGRLPHPFHIDMNTGKVLAQEFWNGVPFRFLEFTPHFREKSKLKVGDVTSQILFEIEQNYDLVFVDKVGEPITYIFGQGYQLEIIEVKE